MGCYDIYCFICGNRCKSVSTDELLETFINIDISKNEINDISKNTKWLNNCTWLLKNNQVIHN